MTRTEARNHTGPTPAEELAEARIAGETAEAAADIETAEAAAIEAVRNIDPGDPRAYTLVRDRARAAALAHRLATELWRRLRTAAAVARRKAIQPPADPSDPSRPAGTSEAPAGTHPPAGPSTASASRTAPYPPPRGSTYAARGTRGPRPPDTAAPARR